MKRRFLKVKIKSLAAEAVIIRLEEKRARGQLRNELHQHRVHDVRSEQRAALLAYAFIRGRDIMKMDRTALSNTMLHWMLQKRAHELVKKFGEPGQADEFALLSPYLAKKVKAPEPSAQAAGISTLATEGSTPSGRSILGRLFA